MDTDERLLRSVCLSALIFLLAGCSANLPTETVQDGWFVCYGYDVNNWHQNCDVTEDYSIKENCVVYGGNMHCGASQPIPRYIRRLAS